MEKIKPIIYRCSLTCRETVCPYCGITNPDVRRIGVDKPGKINECKNCDMVYDIDHPIVRKSKDLLECEKLGLKGPVYKDEKGVWRERSVNNGKS